MTSRLRSAFALALGLLFLVAGSGCGEAWNNPYPSQDAGKTLFYSYFAARPKHLDPVQSYVENEADVLYQTVEPLYDYAYLKRPYQLRPNTAAAMPEVRYLDKNAAPLPDAAPVEQIAFTEYLIRLKPGIRYQPHPAFAQDAAGRHVYFDLPAAELARKYTLSDFPLTSTRELTAEDYAYALRRIARPRLQSPSLEQFKVIDGMEELADRLNADARSGKVNFSGYVDLRRYPLRGVETPDPYTLRIRIKGKYPQFLYWLAMTFVTPMPWEADRFFSQPGMTQHNLTLDAWPIGTGPFMMVKNDPNREMLLLRNPNWRGETYPCEGEAEDRAAGLLKDCGAAMPFVDGIKFVREGGAIAFWNKFLQGYYDRFDTSSQPLASLDVAVTPSPQGFDAVPALRERGISVKSEVEPGIRYFGFNMIDPVVGGDGTPTGNERARKLRQALSIVLDSEEYVQIFESGLGVAAHGPIPPGIAGYKTGAAGINPYVYDWVAGQARRKPVDAARRLLAEAGYANGRDARTGDPLVLYFDTGGGNREMLDWLQRKFKSIDVQLVPRITDFNRFQEKMNKGNAQIYFWGWQADFPDPENFLFLFLTKNGKVKYQGENASNYSNPEFDALYARFKQMDIAADRGPLVDRMVDILRHDAPWVFMYNEQSLKMNNEWLAPAKPGRIVRSTGKYLHVDAALRARRIAARNRPVLWPLGLGLVLLAGGAALAVRTYRRREQQPSKLRGTSA